MSNVNAYEDNSDKLVLDQFVLQYQPLVRKIALYMKRRLPSHIDLDDLLQSGLVGLLEARNTFKSGFDASFETYASIRVRGAMIDALRRNSWVTRDTIKNMKLISDAIRKIEQRNSTQASSNEIAKELGITLDEYHKMSQEASFCSVLSIDELDHDNTSLENDADNPQVITQNETMKTNLKAVLIDLPEREQLVLSLYYVEEFTFKQIGEILEVTEARVCQLHSQAIARVRSKMIKSNLIWEKENADH